jgi:hypothetical protein
MHRVRTIITGHVRPAHRRVVLVRVPAAAARQATPFFVLRSSTSEYLSVRSSYAMAAVNLTNEGN